MELVAGVDDHYSCPWCPVSVVVVRSAEAARDFMEHHLDGHMLLGLPLAGAA